MIPTQSVEKSVAEIERCAKDPRFVQVLMLVMGDMPLGKRAYWPIYAAAERLGLADRHPRRQRLSQPADLGRLGFLSCRGLRRPGAGVPDPVDQPDRRGRVRPASEAEDGDAGKSGFTWLPSYLWRLHKFWRGVRMETPWVDRAPLEIVRSNIRFSLQPVDAPPDPATLNRLFDHMQSDELLLFSTDYPHWQFDGDEVLPEGISPDLVRKIMIDNPHATYPRLDSSPRIKEATP